MSLDVIFKMPHSFPFVPLWLMHWHTIYIQKAEHSRIWWKTLTKQSAWYGRWWWWSSPLITPNNRRIAVLTTAYIHTFAVSITIISEQYYHKGGRNQPQNRWIHCPCCGCCRWRWLIQNKLSLHALLIIFVYVQISFDFDCGLGTIIVGT